MGECLQQEALQELVLEAAGCAQEGSEEWGQTAPQVPI